MKITANISTNSPSLNGNISNDGINLNGNVKIGEFDTSNLKIRVTNLENNAVGTINLSYDNQTSTLTLTTKNTLNEDIGTPQTVLISGGISSIDYDNTTKSLIVTLSNGDTMTVSLKSSFDELANSIPTKTSDLQNDSGFITNAVNNLLNYYTKDEILTLLSQIPKLSLEIVQTLPTASATYWFDNSHTIYLLPKSTAQTSNAYDEYICIRSGTEGSYTYSWEKIGDTEIDLSNYYTKSETDTLLSNKQNTLVSGTNIKSINNNSIVGSGNLTINEGKIDTIEVNGVEQTITNKTVNLIIPNGNDYVEKEITTTQEFGNDEITTYNNVDNTVGLTGIGSTLGRKYDINDGTELGSWMAISSLGETRIHAGTADTPTAEEATSSTDIAISPTDGITISQLKNNETTSVEISEGNVTADKFIKDGGTSSQFLKADGSVDSSTYIKSIASQQTIATNVSGTDIPLILKSGASQASTLAFMNSNDLLIGYIKVDNQNKIYFTDSSVTDHELAFKSNIPTKTSDLSNDSGFITNSVSNLANYYDKTSTDTLLSGKQSSLSSSQLDAVNSGIDSTKVGQIATNTSNISTIEGKIPSTASSSNKLTDEAFVNSSINALAAFFITRTAAGDNFNTYAQLSSATTFYSGGSARIPTTNDYTYVRWDETKGETVTGYTSFTTTSDYIGHYVIYNNEGVEVDSSNKDSLGIVAGTTVAYDNLPTTRYSYQGGTYPNGQWNFQLIVNNSGLTAAQMAAINSGITSSLVTQIGTNQTNIANKMDKANPTGTGSLSLNRSGTVGNYSVALGISSTASGYASHATGDQCFATGNRSNAEGYTSMASGNNSHAQGNATISRGRSQFAFGEFNIQDNQNVTMDDRGEFVEIVGNGTSNANRSNARTLDWQGNEKLAGWLTMNGSVKAVGRSGSASQTVEQALLDNYYTKSQSINEFYPVGSYFLTDNDAFNSVANVQAHFGGTWTQITQTSFYAQHKWSQTTLSQGDYISYTLTITTSGNPIYLNVNGDNNPQADGVNWLRIDIIKDNNTLARQICQSNINSANVPFSLSYLDIVPAGTYSYTFEIRASGGTIQLGEDGNIEAPQCIAYEIGGNKGNLAKYVYKRLT